MKKTNETCAWCKRSFVRDPEKIRLFEDPIRVSLMALLKAHLEGLPEPDRGGVLCDVCCYVNGAKGNVWAKA